MSLDTNIANVAFASQYNVDKIVGIYTGSFKPNTSDTTTLGGYLYQYPVPHSFTRPVFTDLIWSTDNITFIDGGSGNGTGSTIAYSDSSNLYVTTGISSGTIYYKVIATWIDDYDSTNPSITPVLNTTQPRIFDSTANYQKVVLPGKVTVQAAGSGSLDLKIPQAQYGQMFPNAKLYFESVSGQVWPSIGGGTRDYFLYDSAHQWESYLQIEGNEYTGTSDGQIEIIGNAGASASSARFWYRIYGDTQ